jgi:hypothetical protein
LIVSRLGWGRTRPARVRAGHDRHADAVAPRLISRRAAGTKRSSAARSATSGV